jgi:hypothetical protein
LALDVLGECTRLKGDGRHSTLAAVRAGDGGGLGGEGDERHAVVLAVGVHRVLASHGGALGIHWGRLGVAGRDLLRLAGGIVALQRDLVGIHPLRRVADSRRRGAHGHAGDDFGVGCDGASGRR